MIKPLSIEKLRRRTNPKDLGFETTMDIGGLETLIGQKRAVDAISFGLKVSNKGYNIFVVGSQGSGRTTYTLERVKENAKKEKAPNDYLYAYNFDNPEEPIALSLPAGKGPELAKHMSDMVEELKGVLSKAFENSEYEDAKAQLVKEFQEDVNNLMEELRSWALTKGFAIKRTPQGFVNIPVILDEDSDSESDQDQEETHASPDDKKTKPKYKEMQQEDFEALSEEEQKELQKRSEEVSQKTLEVLRLVRDKEKELKEKIKTLEAEICRTAIMPYMQELKDKFGDEGKLGEWFNALQEDIISNFSVFVAAARDESISEQEFSRYDLNVFVTNDPENGAPVVWETNPSYYNLAGKIEYESRQGILATDFRKIIAGAIQKANGGYLILQAEEVLRNFMSWDTLKRVIRTQKIRVENLGEQLGIIPVSSLRPEPIDINLKVILIGSRLLYHLLNIYDPEFQKLFKVKADFDIDMPRNLENEKQMALFVAGFVQKEKLKHFSADAVAELIEWSSRLAEHSQRMSTQFNKICEVIVEASAWAGEEEVVRKEHVIKALREKQFRSNLVEERIFNSFKDGTVKIQTDGLKVGQINGLTVVDMGDYSFGHPVRITANTYMGSEGVVNIEREVKMTGPIHNKGLLILESYLGAKYAQEFPLSLSARITFEQTYSGIEGDSASSTELYCLLSSLSDVPLKQGIAVTGSVDQHGNVQPIGGVNEKIEGFFKYCKVNGLTGEQGVIIPEQNVKHLMLDHEVLDAVASGKFHIWAVKNVDEGIELLTGIEAGVPDDKGCFPPDSIHGRVMAKLRGWMEKAARLKKDLDKADRCAREKQEKETDEDKDKSNS
ncbi:peptidase S16 lon domain protein [Thermovirga lienii DSM 17291]|jgi:lon-related putative ATP-dependent protease|uniref:endopeptidase La n=1 Tax=Thermovirga lienii (strain ATCC BAA-1197 / DSM 17291 / Cas60314) TaxID=580340 RepID=G7VAA6_THELD|nr:ATP-binding protein [Thermovirga lienii]AER66806.1 peptidase S16 lon domain protein [Thermovirga lienii DSM 17291]MDN5318244.1 hypothetical protein [Thermovirga sp.]MDN5367386.1 hypothetical protein [Thermovirga sp.]HCD71879.1 ATP-dependent protease [Thermovirga lienii]